MSKNTIISDDLRVVIPHLTNQKITVNDREVWVDGSGLTDPLNDKQYERLRGIGYPCWTTYKFPVAPPDPTALVVLSPAELSRIEAAGFRLVPLTDTFTGTGGVAEEWAAPSEEDLAEKGDDLDEGEEGFQELVDAWLDMDVKERVDTVQELEVDPTGLEPFLRYLYDFEGHHLNSPEVLAAIDLALSRVLPKQTAESINQKLFEQSAEGKVKTKNPPSRKRGGK